MEGLEAIRKRPGMYIGNIDTKGLHHLIWEILDNSIDEVLAGYASNIFVILNKDGSVTIGDDGRGIPVEVHPKTGLSTLETVYTILHAGGKFGGEKSGYKVSGGLHGVGASVVNALSKFCEIEVCRDYKRHTLKFIDGGKSNSGLQRKEKTKKWGTKVTFLPDFSFFNEGVDSFDADIIESKIKELSFLNKGLTISLLDKRKRNSEEKIFKFENGLIDFIKYVTKSNEKIIQEIIYAEGEKQNVIVEVAMQYITAFQPKILSYVNNIPTAEGGTHVQGVLDAVLRIINKYSEQILSQKEKEIFTREDIKEGLTLIISVKHPDPMYEGQTKNKFSNLEVRKIANTIFSNKFESFLFENPDQATAIINKMKLAAKSRLAAQKAKELTRRKNFLEFSTLPGKLADCSSNSSESTELFIVEGDSAGGSAKMGRDREIQAILPLRGKVINSERARLDKLLANNEITSLITAFGTGISNEFDITKLRYSKIIIMTDADVDGSHIRALLLTFLFRYFNKLIVNGNIYIACPPLFK